MHILLVNAGSDLADQPLAQQMGRNGYQAIQTMHSWSQRARQLLAEVEELEG